MIRFGPNGLNQSYGNRNIKIDVLLSGMHSIRPNSTFIVSDFRDVKLESDDLVYADPPYIDCFDMYKWKWDEEDQQKLLEKLYKHHLNGGKYILSGLSIVNGEDNTKNITIPESRIIPIKKSYKITSTKGKTRKNHQEIIVTNL